MLGVYLYLNMVLVMFTMGISAIVIWIHDQTVKIDELRVERVMSYLSDLMKEGFRCIFCSNLNVLINFILEFPIKIKTNLTN